MGPFLTSYCRMVIANHLRPIADQCVRIHTDGFIVSKTVSKELKLKMGTGLWEWKIEHEGSCTVTHVNKIEWF